MEFLGLYLLSFLVTTSYQSLNYRLPPNSQPYHYKIKVIPHLNPDNFSFDGETDIFLNVFNQTNNLTLHSHNLQIRKEETFLRADEGNVSVPSQHIIDEELQFLILSFPYDLEPGRYTLHLKYTGSSNDDSTGLSLIAYNDDNSTQRYLAATIFEPTSARKIFPCWDEPSIKATFDIEVNHFPNYTALSSTPLKERKNDIEFDEKVWSIFETTPQMSTYTVSFAVIDFEKISNSYGNVSLRSTNKGLEMLSYAFNSSLRAISILEEYTGIPNEMRKLDIMFIPNSVNNTINQTELNSTKDTVQAPDTFSSVQINLIHSNNMINQVTHQWFGSLVTPAWWKDTWITEGLANYFTHFLIAKMGDFPRDMDYYVVSTGFDNFDNKTMSATLPELRDVKSPEEISTLVSSPFSRAALIMHMISGLMSEEVFHTGIQKLFQRYRYSGITSDDFWQTMQENMNEYHLPYTQFDLKTVIEPYLSRKGYPIVHAIRNYTTGLISLKQECAYCDGNWKWWIPINIATSSSPNFSSTFATHWMNPDEDELAIEGIDPEDWIIINIQSSGFYRVIYDMENWNRLSDYLNSDKFSNIHPLNRATLLNEAFRFRTAEKRFSADFLVKLASYLTREVDYIPWVVAENVLDRLNTDKKNLFPNLTQNLVEDVGLEERPEDNAFTILKRALALRVSCKYAKRHC